MIYKLFVEVKRRTKEVDKTIFDDELETCNVCGLAEDLCVCTEVAKTEARLKVILVRRKWGKYYTLVEGLDPKEFKLKDISKRLRSRLACGGTVKGVSIELQGNHKFRIVDMLTEMGFEKDSIDIISK